MAQLQNLFMVEFSVNCSLLAEGLVRAYPEAWREILALTGPGGCPGSLYTDPYLGPMPGYIGMAAAGLLWKSHSLCVGVKSTLYAWTSSAALFLLAACSFSDPRSTGVTGGLLCFMCPLVCWPTASLEWLLSSCHVTVGRFQGLPDFWQGKNNF